MMSKHKQTKKESVTTKIDEIILQIAKTCWVNINTKKLLWHDFYDHKLQNIILWVLINFTNLKL
jgi:hypothetical protein